MKFRNFRITNYLVVVFVCCAKARPQGIPEKVKEFSQKQFFAPMQDAIQSNINITWPNKEEDDALGPSTTTTQSLEVVTVLFDTNVETTTLIPNKIEMPTVPSENQSRTLNYMDSNSIAMIKQLCPELENKTYYEIISYRYEEEAGACFRYGFQKPCGLNMKLFIKEFGSIYGICDCKQDARMYLYHKESNACYKIFSEGKCPKGHYFDLTKEAQPICNFNPCAANGTDFVKVRGVCTKIGQPNPQICDIENSVVDFIPKRRSPECVLTQKLATGVGILPCAPGSSIAIHGKCHLTEWDFGDE